jgi:hypothetical protein
MSIIDGRWHEINPGAQELVSTALNEAWERGLAAGITSLLTSLTPTTYAIVQRETASYAACDVPAIQRAFAKAAEYHAA